VHATQPASDTSVATTVTEAPSPPETPTRDEATGRADGSAQPERRRLDVTLPHIAGFDGLRGWVLPLFLVGHHGWTAVPGGAFAVSMFFTLSGFLIASLMLAEWSRSERVSMARFWERRARRLLPAAIATVVLVVLLQWWFGVGSGPKFEGDMLGALGYVANWRLAASGTDYSATWALESPVQHFWSLAVEEQFYLAFPLVFVIGIRLLRHRWGLVGLLFGAAAAASFAAAWVSSASYGNVGITYYATYTRVGEILAGVALAFLLATAPVKRFLATRRGAVTAGWLGIIGVATFCWLLFTVGLQEPFFFQGGTFVNSVATAFIIVTCVTPQSGLLLRVLCVAPARNFGLLTYGVYLFHIPIYLWLDHDRTGLDFWPLFALRMAVLIPIVLLSYHLLECPVRFRMRMPRPRLTAVLTAAGVAAAIVAVVVPVGTPQRIDLAGASSDDSPFQADIAVPEEGATAAARILMIGDSVTWTMLPGLQNWNTANAEQIHVDAHYAIACTLGEPGTIRSLGVLEEPIEPCVRLRADLPETLERHDYDAIVVTLGGKDFGDRMIDDQWRHLGDPVFDEWLRPQIDELADIVAAEGAPVFWSRAPYVRVAQANTPGSDWRDFADNDPARADRLNELFTDEISGRPGFTMLPVDEWTRGLPGGEFDTDYREDGVHLTRRGSDEFAAWLVPRILAAAGGPDDR
jgi:peptidoglycan/LPS O-acetylase OafA/YrhL/lysophospholipase L1-like esterase